MSKNYLAHSTTMRSLGVAILAVGLFIAPIYQADALSVPGDFIPTTSQSDEPSSEQQSPPVATPGIDQPVNEVNPATPVPALVEPLTTELPAEPILSPVVSPITLPVGLNPVVQPSASVEAVVQSSGTTAKLQGRAQPNVERLVVANNVKQPTKPVSFEQISTITAIKPAAQNATVLAVGTTDTVGSIAGDFLGDPRQSSVAYSSNQITPEVAKSYYYGALGLSGAGVLLYSMSLLSGSRLSSSSLSRGFGIR